MREREIRTPNHNLMFCKAVLTEEGKVMLEFKNGKRSDRLSVEEFFAEINNFAQGCVPKLHIVTE